MSWGFVIAVAALVTVAFALWDFGAPPSALGDDRPWTGPEWRHAEGGDSEDDVDVDFDFD